MTMFDLLFYIIEYLNNKIFNTFIFLVIYSTVFRVFDRLAQSLDTGGLAMSGSPFDALPGGV